MNRVALILAACAALAACQTPRERIVTKVVKVPVPVPCSAKVEPRQPYAADAVSLDAPLFELVQALLIDREQRKAREAVVEAALGACTS